MCRLSLLTHKVWLIIIACTPFSCGFLHPIRNINDSMSSRRMDGFSPLLSTKEASKSFDVASSQNENPTLPPSNPDDEFFRSFRKNTPKRFQYFLRDSGMLRFIVDQSTFLIVPELIKDHPSALIDFLKLSSIGRYFVPLLPEQSQESSILETDISIQKLNYGSHPRQLIEMFEPSTTKNNNYSDNNNRCIVFIHGGAWGSGFPAMYRLIAPLFLNKGFRVAIVGYRTYPSANIVGQMEDISMAVERIRKMRNFNDVTLIGHSSGAHISAVALIKKYLKNIDNFVSLSSMFDLPKHYQYERIRGVERISPLSIVCGVPGNYLEKWKENSPQWLVEKSKAITFGDNESTSSLLGNTRYLLIHGDMDSTVPYATAETFFRTSQKYGSVTLRILPDIGHVEPLYHLMFGGETHDVILGWLEQVRLDKGREEDEG